MAFVPQAQPRPLPPVGMSIERPFMDWKVKPAANTFEKAKDVAMFANHLGGTLLLGAAEQNGHLSAYVGMSVGEAGVLRDEYSKAVATLCQPRPHVDFDEYDDPKDSQKRIVAVNTWPSLTLVGVKVVAHQNPGGYSGPSFVYPVRSGTDCIYLEPSQLAMYMTPQVRRTAVLLSLVPRETVVVIKTWVPVSISGVASRGTNDYVAILVDVMEDQNIVAFRGTDGAEMRRIPLDCITTVFEDWDSQMKKTVWRIFVDYER